MTQRHGIYSVPLPVSGKKVAASVVTLAAIWRSGRDSNPRAIARKLISSQPRYAHFDTAAYRDQSVINQTISLNSRTVGRNQEKPEKI